MHEALRRLLVVAVVLHRDTPGAVRFASDRSTARVFDEERRGAEGPTDAAVGGDGDAEPSVPVRHEDDVSVLIERRVRNAAVGGESLQRGELSAVRAFGAPHRVAERHEQDAAAAVRVHEDGRVGHVLPSRDPVPVPEAETVRRGLRHVDVVRPLDGRGVSVATVLPRGGHRERHGDRSLRRGREGDVDVAANRLLSLRRFVELGPIADHPGPVALLAEGDASAVLGHIEKGFALHGAGAEDGRAVEPVGPAALHGDPLAHERAEVLGDAAERLALTDGNHRGVIVAAGPSAAVRVGIRVRIAGIRVRVLGLGVRSLVLVASAVTVAFVFDESAWALAGAPHDGEKNQEKHSAPRDRIMAKKCKKIK